ncbi:FtsQ-type POTRA domain-containing protein [Candidatus Pelagibacter sp.]|nr:FtsQ-type POTRA domain-containing protein [Candidatus Pelagibacter sp.]
MHQRTNKKIFVYLLIFFTLVTINNKKLSYDFYKINKFNINGLSQIETEKLINNFEIFRNTNIFTFKKKNISKIIYDNKIIEDFSVIKVYPSTLNIDIQKTKILARTKKNGKDYLVLGNGNLITTENSIFELPFIFGNLNIDNFIKLKDIIDSSKFDFKSIKSFYYFKSNRWDILTNEGLTLKMPYNLTVQKLNFIFKIVKKETFNNVKIFDFRQKNMMVIDG